MDHIVHLYENDHDLAAFVAGFVAGRPALVIARRHRHAALAGPTVELVDADELLTELLVDGMPDPARFDAAVADRVRARHEPVRIYGEMVDILWQDGNVVGALALESLWADLLRTVPFELCCGYERDAVHAHDGGAAAVCRAHHRTVQRFAGTIESPRAARHFVTGVLPGGAPADDIALVVTELATNAVVHAGGGFALEIGAEPDVVRIAVSDDSDIRPAARQASAVAYDGRGLQIVASLASRWGFEPTSTGKVIWAEFG